jgi:hypothetical protein
MTSDQSLLKLGPSCWANETADAIHRGMKLFRDSLKLIKQSESYMCGAREPCPLTDQKQQQGRSHCISSSRPCLIRLHTLPKYMYA